MHYPRLLLAAVASGLLASVLPAAAASGDVVSIALRDFNHNGKIDRAVIAIANPDRAGWKVGGTAGLSIAYNGAALRLEDAFMDSAASDPALLEVVIDETDAALPISTSVAGFEVSYVRVGLAGVSDGTRELTAIAADDASSTTTERDEAGPVLTVSTPLSGSYHVSRTADLTLFFSEPVDASSLVPASSENPGEWFFTPQTDGRSVRVSHRAYRAGATESFGIAGRDLAGNAIVLDAYPNPFSFRVTTDDLLATQVDTVFALTSPVPFSALDAGGANILAWYTNQTDVKDVRLSYSTDGGQTYASIAVVPRSQGVYVWYPPKITSTFQLRAEALGTTGNVLNVHLVSTLSMTGEPVPLRAVSAPEVTQPSPSSAVVSLRLDRAPATASLSCEGLAPVQSVLTGTRPVKVEASLSGLTEGVTYTCAFLLTDASGAATRVEVPPFRAELDVTGPVLVGPAVIDGFDAAARTARLSWTTDEPSRAEVSYGLYLDYGGRASLSAYTTDHEVTLVGLTPGALHQVRITSFDGKGNASVSRDYAFVFLREGDLIKGTGAAVYWHKGGKRYVFPHEYVYRSWFGADFSKVLSVPDTQLGTIQLGGNIRMKEGVYLVKIQSDPKTYAVEPDGVLRWIQTEADARALYGSAWAARVRDIDVSLWPDYVIAPPLESGERPAGYIG